MHHVTVPLAMVAKMQCISAFMVPEQALDNMDVRGSKQNWAKGQTNPR